MECMYDIVCSVHCITHLQVIRLKHTAIRIYQICYVYISIRDISLAVLFLWEMDLSFLAHLVMCTDEQIEQIYQLLELIRY